MNKDHELNRKEEISLHFLKSAWSDIIILKSNHHTAIIDTGFEKQYEEIKKYLDEMKIKKISFILLTHFHRDHYGCIPYLVKDYDVEKVYFKNYSGLDLTTACGTPANDQYRLDEYNKCIAMKKIIKENSKLIEVEGIEQIEFSQYKLNLYNTSNSMKEIYDDKQNKEYYHKLCFNENQNSLAVFIKIKDTNIFLGGDIQDKASNHPKANYINTQIARKINQQIDIYKVPHHGTIYCNSDQALNIYKPKIAIITNEEKYIKEESTIVQDLKRANKKVKILLTEKENLIFKIFRDGNISYEKVNEFADSTKN